MEDICAKGGYVAILDMNEENGQELVKKIGSGKTKFFECNVLETESIEKAVKGSVEWAKETGKVIGGVVAAAGVSTPAKVRISFHVFSYSCFHGLSLELFTEIIRNSFLEILEISQ